MYMTIATILGGLGIFLLAVTMITDGLKLAAGDALRDVLERWTRTPLRGLVFGAVVTSLVRSSSAVTVATIGFVNAGLLNLRQSLGVVYGANIGTTTTGWLVAFVGLDFKIETLALPMIGLGMLARLAGSERRFGALGEALAGFGLFFIGIEFLRQAFAGFTDSMDVAALSPQGPLGILLYVGVGFLMTVITQSSGAAIAITLTAAAGGVLTLEAAAATVIGTNIGTTSTAMLAVLGATANARRVAAAHVLFNVLTGVVALALLPAMLWSVRVAEHALGIPDAPALALAGFHSVFNVLGVLLMWPFTARLAGFLEHRFVSRVEVLARPQFIDRTTMGAPTLALEALGRELERAALLAHDAAVASMGRTNRIGPTIGTQAPGGPAVPAPALAATVAERSAVIAEAAEKRHALVDLLESIERFIAQLETRRLSTDEVERLAAALRICNYLEDVTTLSRTVADHALRVDAVRRAPVDREIAAYEAEIQAHLERCDVNRVDFDAETLEDGYQRLRGRWHQLKSQLLEAAVQRQIPIDPLNPALEALRACLKITEQMTKVTTRMTALRAPGHDPDAVAERESAAH